jgi:RNA polymerase II-associated protein 2
MAVSRDPRHLEIALRHANIIQNQKDVESRILDALEKLIDYPLSPDSVRPESPASSDIAEVRSLLLMFRPSDYDDLIEERHCATKCGYVLCPRPPTKQDTKAKFRVIGKSGPSFKVVPREKLELWCSMDCARRAMYVKVQLDEEPAWRRTHTAYPELTFLTDNTDSGLRPSKQIEDKARSKVEEQTSHDHALGVTAESQNTDISDFMAKLAIERGQSIDPASVIPNGLINSKIVEKAKAKAPEAPSLDDEAADLANMIEGYQIGGNSREWLD